MLVRKKKNSLREGESRLAALQLEAQRVQERIPPQHQQILRRSWQNCVFVWQSCNERDELRSELDSRVGEGQEIRQRRTRFCDGRPSIGCRSMRSDGNDDQSVRCHIEDERLFLSIGSWFVNITLVRIDSADGGTLVNPDSDGFDNHGHRK